jgi:RimJ/RimL family protein N-acetyltransferase
MDFELRAATLDDAEEVADLETARTPDDPHDAAMVAYRWTHDPDAKHALRLIGNDAYLAARHGDWEAGARRFGTGHVTIRPGAWNPALFNDCLARAETWLRSDEAEVSVTRIRADFENELAVAQERGYRETRQNRHWELDLVAHRKELLAAAERSREAMRRAGVLLATLQQDNAPETLRKVHELDLASTRDIPTTVPHKDLAFDVWCGMYFENPGVRKDRFWIARLGDEVVGMSLIEYPPERGVPTTEYTGTSPRYRGRGIARALKYETIEQAIELGVQRVRTDNDSENAPILHINAEMGYEPRTPYIELHREL